MESESADWPAAGSRVEMRLAAIVESSNDAIFSKDLRGVIQTWNRGAERMYGWTAAEAVGQPAAKLIFPVGGRDEEEKLLKEVAAGRTYRSEDAHRVRKDGTPVEVSVAASPIKDAEGKVVGVSVSAHDVGEARRAEAALRRSETLLREAQAIARLGSWELDMASNQLHWSDEAYRIFEVDPQRFHPTYDAFLAAFHPEDRAQVDGAYKDSVARRAPYAIEHRLLMADGSVKFVRVEGHTRYGSDGRPMRSVGTIQDITDRVLEARSLRRSEQMLEETQRLAKVAGWSYEPGSKRFTATAELARIYDAVPGEGGFTPQDLIDGVAEPDRAKLSAAFAAAVERGTPYELDLAVVTGKGERRTIHTVGNAEKQGGTVERVFGHVLDITMLKAEAQARADLERQGIEVKRLEELNRMRIDFLNTAAHDLKTPLTPLKLQMATLRMKGNLDNSQVKSLELMDRNLLRFQALIEDMLDAARLQAGKLKLRRAETALAPLVQEAVASFEEAAKQGKLQFAFDSLADARIDADSMKCMQVLMNLVSNTVKYTSAGGHVRIGITATPTEAIVKVADDGLGMTPEQLGKLFQPFVRLHEEIPGTAKGTGLGLYISKGIVEQHGGRLWAESAGTGKGSTFFVAWPLAKAGVPQANPAPADPERNAPVSGNGLNGRRTLSRQSSRT